MWYKHAKCTKFCVNDPIFYFKRMSLWYLWIFQKKFQKFAYFTGERKMKIYDPETYNAFYQYMIVLYLETWQQVTK